MKNSIVRLSEISIRNFKNVKQGQLYFGNHRKKYRSSILGLYGQNGSGKTALIDALQLLKYTLCGKAVPFFFSSRRRHTR
ncbi:DNA replication and repair protein RecF [Clostridioides difficile]|nr:DNA replication and repair protein RecF [Clostridioides difficile]